MVKIRDDNQAGLQAKTLRDDEMKRRQAVQLLGGIGTTLITMPRSIEIVQEVEGLLHDEEMLSICAAYIPIYWRLYFEGHLSEVQQFLDTYLSQLAVLVRQPTVYQKQSAILVAKMHQLACMMALQKPDYGWALIHADQAIEAARIAEDVHLQAASLIRKGLVYRYLKRFDQMLNVYEEGQQYSNSVSPLLSGRLYTGLAEAYSNVGQGSKALQSLERAYKLFPDNPKDDLNFSYTHFKLPHGFEVRVYLNLKQPDKAWEALALVDKSIPQEIVPDRVELSIDQADASLQSGDIDQACSYLRNAVTSALVLGSKLRYYQAYTLYKQMLVKWSHEKQVKDQIDLFIK
jgi:tetratricopeptide (TPR) repeat protein